MLLNNISLSLGAAIGHPVVFSAMKMAERKIHGSGHTKSNSLTSHGENRHSGNGYRRNSSKSEDSDFHDDHDDVFETPSNEETDEQPDRTFHQRCDSGVSSQGRSVINSNSESRSSAHSWHTSSNKTNVSEHSSSVKSIGSPQTGNRFGKVGKYFGKNKQTKCDEEPAAGREVKAETPQRTRFHRLRNGADVTTNSQNDPKYVNRSLDYFVEPSTMIRSLKLLENRQASDKQFAETGQQITFGTCAVGFFDKNGGRLTLPSASLHIPVGAIRKSEPQMVYIYELPSRHGEPKLKGNETWLTPTVECGPPGLEFAKDVFLSLQHCAINHSQWHVSGHRGDNLSSEWDLLQSGKDTVLFVDDKKVTLAINHFSPYKVSGSASNSNENESTVSKWMKAAIFPTEVVSSDEGTSASYQLRVCNLQDWKVVLYAEGIDDESTISSESFPVADDGQNIDIRVKDIHPDWQVTDDDTARFITFDDVWSEYQDALSLGRLSIPFQLKSSSSATTSTERSNDDKTDLPLFRMEIKQMEEAVIELVENVPTGDRVKRNRQNISRQVTEEEICQEIENRFLAQQTILDPEPHSLHFLSDIRYRRVCTALDHANNIQRGWSAFAASMRVNDIQIQGSLETWSRIRERSPSAMLLDFFFHDNHGLNLIDTLKMLSSLLLEIENNTAKAIVDDEIYEREHGNERRYFDSDSPFITEDTVDNVFIADESVASSATGKGASVKPKPKYLKWVANFSGFVSTKLRPRLKRPEELVNTIDDFNTALAKINPEPEAAVQLNTMNNNGSCDQKQYISKPALKQTNSIGVDSLFSRDNSSGTSISEVSNVVTVKNMSTPDESDTMRYLQPTKPLSRHGMHDSGVFSHRGSSKSSSSLFQDSSG